MTVRKLINKLLDCNMDADVVVELKITRDIIDYSLDEWGDLPCPIDDDAEIKRIVEYYNGVVHIELKALEKGAIE